MGLVSTNTESTTLLQLPVSSSSNDNSTSHENPLESGAASFSIAGVSIGIAAGALLLIAVVVTVVVVLCRRRARLRNSKPVPNSFAEAVHTGPASSLWSTDSSQRPVLPISHRAPVVPAATVDRHANASPQSRRLNINSYVKRTVKSARPMQTATAKTAAATAAAHRHSMPVPMSSRHPTVAETLLPGCSSDRTWQEPACSLMKRVPHTMHARTTASLEQLSNSPRLKASNDAMGRGCQLALWHSLASADSGLASSLSSFSDADRITAAEVRYRGSRLQSLSSCESLATSSQCSLAGASPPPLLPSESKDLKEHTTQTSRTAKHSSPAADILEEVFVGCSLDSIRELVRQFETLSSTGNGVPVGTVYCTPSFAIGTFDQSGGCLFFTPDRSCSLTIPPGALAEPQTVYFGVIYESGGSGGAEANFTPTYECGPSGLRFLKPVQLRTMHCIAPDSAPGQVSAFVREDDCSQWSDSNDANVSYDRESAVLSLMHFTGYKLACSMRSSSGGSGSSRIPRPVGQAAPIRKRLYLCSFRCDGKIRLYYLSRDEVLYNKICGHEFANGSSMSSPKKPFIFTYHDGDLLVKVLQPFNTLRRFEACGILANSFDYAELSRVDGITSFDILIKQESGTAESYITATFETRRQSGDPPPRSLEHLSEELLLSLSISMARQMSLAQSFAGVTPVQDAGGSSLPACHPLLPSDTRQVSSSFPRQLAATQGAPAMPEQPHHHANELAADATGQCPAHRLEGPTAAALADSGRVSCGQYCGSRGSSGSGGGEPRRSTVYDQLSLSLTAATEGCECMTASAGPCCDVHCQRQDGSASSIARCLSPGEYSDDSSGGGCTGPLPPLQRNKARASKESGYVSPHPSLGDLDLHGPTSLSPTPGTAAAADTQATSDVDDLTTVAGTALGQDEGRRQQQPTEAQPPFRYHGRLPEWAADRPAHGYAAAELPSSQPDGEADVRRGRVGWHGNRPPVPAPRSSSSTIGYRH